MKKMKTIMAVLILSFIGLNSINAQSKMKNALKVTPLTIIKGQALMIHYERAVIKNMTVGVGVAPIFTAPLIGTLAYPADKMKSGIAVDPEIRWYAKSDKIMDGFFFGLYNSNRFSSWESTNDIVELFNPNDSPYDSDELNVSARKTIVGLQLGTHRLLGDHFSIDFYSGFGLSGSKTTAKYASNNLVYDEIITVGANLRLNIAVGWVF